MQEPPATGFLVVLLGSTAVGKTSLVSRFAGQSIPKAHRPTVGCDLVEATLNLDGQVYKLTIRDTAGQEAYNALAPVYCRDARGAIVLFSVTDRPSFEALSKWTGLLTDASPGAAIVVFGNKTDDTDARVVDSDHAQEFCDRAGLLYLEGSALTGENAAAPFEAIARLVGQARPIADGPTVASGGCRC
jgi:small GTP-binding protein